jgi:hypothetical protein
MIDGFTSGLYTLGREARFIDGSISIRISIFNSRCRVPSDCPKGYLSTIKLVDFFMVGLWIGFDTVSLGEP